MIVINEIIETTYPFCLQFKYASRTEKALTIVGALCSAAVGAGDPLCFFLFGDLVNDLSSPQFKADDIYQTAIYFAVLGLLVLLVGFTQVFCLHYSSLRQTHRIRLLYFTVSNKALLSPFFKFGLLNDGW